MSNTIFTYLCSMVLLAALSSNMLAAESAKPSQLQIVRQGTAANLDRASGLLEQEVLAEERVAEQPPKETPYEDTSSANPPQNSSTEIALVARHKKIMRNAIAENWTPTGTVRTDGPVVIHMRLTPKGQIISSAIGKSSGAPSFDRAALQAVENTERFPEMQNLPTAVFERNFREFDLLLRPEDLFR